MTQNPGKRGRRKEPTQERSKQLVSCIIEAGLKLLEKEGPQALTTTRVAEVAGVSIGSVYQYFSDRDGIVDAVYRQKLEIEWGKAQEWGGYADLPVWQLIDLIIDKAVERHRRFLELHAEFYRDRVNEFSLDNFSVESEFQSVDWFREVFEARADELQLEHPEYTAYLVSRGISAILHTTIQERPEFVFDDAFIEELKGFVTSFLRAKSRTSRISY